MFTEAERVQIRHVLGFGATFVQADPRLENAVTAVQAIVDGGSRPDGSTEQFVRNVIYGMQSLPGPPFIPAIRGILQIEADIDNLQGQQGAISVDEVTVNPARETARLRGEGRRKVKSLAQMLGMRRARADIFSPSNEPFGDGDPFTTNGSPYW